MRRIERKNRDEFRKILEEHAADGTLTAKTQWRDYCMKVLLQILIIYEGELYIKLKCNSMGVFHALEARLKLIHVFGLIVGQRLATVRSCCIKHTWFFNTKRSV